MCPQCVDCATILSKLLAKEHKHMKSFQLIFSTLILSVSPKSAGSHTERPCLQVPIFGAEPLMFKEPMQHVHAL